MLRAQFRRATTTCSSRRKMRTWKQPRRRYFEGITNASEIMRISRRFSNVVACAPVLRGTLTARAGFENATIDLFGIDPALHLRTTDIGQQIIEGKFEDFRNNPSSVIVGSRLAEALGVGAGDTVQLLSPSGEYWRFTVAAVARSGVGAVDSTRVYCQSKIAQRLLHKPYPATMILYKLRDPDRAPALAQHFEQLFQHEARSWQDREEANLQLFLTLRISAAITVRLIILLAGFGIFNVLTMTVLSKIKEIAILRSIGYSRRDISAIFLWQGALIAALGSILGCVHRRALGHRGFAHSAARPRSALRGLFSRRFRLAPLFVGHSARARRGFDRELCAGASRRATLARLDPPRHERLGFAIKRRYLPEFLTPGEIRLSRKISMNIAPR